MRESIRSFFQKNMAVEQNGSGIRRDAGVNGADAERRKLHVAACALLLELAHADEQFSEGERTHIEAVLQRHFGLDDETARELMELAESERANAIDLYQFTSLIRSSYDLGQKTLLAEIMWSLVMTDGRIAHHEAHMLRKIASLLDLEPGYLAAARKRASGE
ncbi:MAG TPA: TerB family tellurite resistance protein [Longimicrobiales bacterium]